MEGHKVCRAQLGYAAFVSCRDELTELYKEEQKAGGTHDVFDLSWSCRKTLVRDRR